MICQLIRHLAFCCFRYLWSQQWVELESQRIRINSCKTEASRRCLRRFVPFKNALVVFLDAMINGMLSGIVVGLLWLDVQVSKRHHDDIVLLLMLPVAWIVGTISLTLFWLLMEIISHKVRPGCFDQAREYFKNLHVIKQEYCRLWRM